MPLGCIRLSQPTRQELNGRGPAASAGMKGDAMASALLTKHDVHEGRGRAFEDILDGYFPLEESVRQMMERQGFSRAWLQLLHAPTMDLPGLAPTDPVPLSLRKVYAGMIDYMAIEAVQAEGAPRLNGCGDWFWIDPSNRSANLSPSVRLGEPAFVRGVGISRDPGEETPFDVRLAMIQAENEISILDGVAKDLGWATSWLWSTETGEAAIRPMQSADGTPPVGVSLGVGEEPGLVSNGTRTPMSYLLIDATPGTASPEALDILTRIKPSI